MRVSEQLEDFLLAARSDGERMGRVTAQIA